MQKSRYAINIVAIMIDNIYRIYNKKKITRPLLIDIKGVFNYISRLKLAQWIRQLRIDNNLKS